MSGVVNFVHKLLLYITEIIALQWNNTTVFCQFIEQLKAFFLKGFFINQLHTYPLINGNPSQHASGPITGEK